MKKIGIIIFIGALIVGVVLANFFSFGSSVFKSPISFSFSKVKGSGNIVTEKRDISNFKNVDVSGIFKVEIVAQKDFSVEIEADDNLLALIKTELDGDTLKIDKEKSFSCSRSAIIRISAPNIEEFDASGVTKSNISNLNNESLKIDLSGASKVNVEGKTNNLEIDMSGASKVKAQELKAKSVVVDGSGASKAYINVAENLRVDLSGASRVNYFGNPTQINKKTSGAGSLKQNEK